MNATTQPLETWRKVWREGFVPLFNRAGLEALRDALANNAKELTQSMTTVPLCVPLYGDSVCEGACAVAMVGWKGLGLTTVAEVEDYFAAKCSEVDRRMNKLYEVYPSRAFLNWFDDTLRGQMREALLAEVEFNLQTLGAAA